MKKSLFLLLLLNLGLSASPMSYAESSHPQINVNKNVTSQISILEKYQMLHPKKKSLDDSIWENYLNPYGQTEKALNQMIDLLYQQMLSKINSSTEFDEEQKQLFRLELEEKIKAQKNQLPKNDYQPHPLYLKAHQYAVGKGVKQNDIKANDLLLKMAQADIDLEALEFLAIRKMHGIGKGNEQADAIQAFENLAELYDEKTRSPIWAYLSYVYTYGIGVNKDLDKAQKYWKLAKHHYSLDFDRTGVIGYMMGQMVEENSFLNEPLDRAMNYYVIATRANDNNIAAQQAILKLLKSDKKFKDLTYETELFQAEAGAQRNEADAYFTLSELYGQEQWTIFNPKRAIEYLEKSAQLGYENAFVDLGRFYANGHLVERNSKKAIEWYETGFENGSFISGIFLIELYEQGNADMPQNQKEAQLWETKVTKAYREAGYNTPLPKVSELRIHRRLYQ